MDFSSTITVSLWEITISPSRKNTLTSRNTADVNNTACAADLIRREPDLENHRGTPWACACGRWETKQLVKCVLSLKRQPNPKLHPCEEKEIFELRISLYV